MGIIRFLFDPLYGFTLNNKKKKSFDSFFKKGFFLLDFLCWSFGLKLHLLPQKMAKKCPYKKTKAFHTAVLQQNVKLFKPPL